MDYKERLKNVSVLGAAGKMGSGILLLTAMEMADLALDPKNSSQQFVLNAVDISDSGLIGLMQFMRVQVQKAAEKKTVLLRKVYSNREDLIENRDIIEQYVSDVLKIIRPTTCLEPVYQSTLVFEAIKEDPELKVNILSQIDQNNKNSAWYFSNTSSIPIRELDEKANLGGRMIGFHFYNPPAVQKLVELIAGGLTKNELIDFSREFAKKLGKKIVPSKDFAGFIGNGHFMRDALHGIAEVEKLGQEIPFPEAIYIINKVSQEFLIRPMGIFQLIDYVGLEVCSYIMKVMNPYLENEDLHSPLLDKLISQGVLGGQHADASQKDGFLRYEKGRPVSIYDPEKKDYLSMASFKDKCDKKLGPLPSSALPWKAIIANPDKNEILKNAFSELTGMDSLGAELALRYGIRSKQIGKKLVQDGIAENDDGLNTVLLTGFYHSYGPINDYFN